MPDSERIWAVGMLALVDTNLEIFRFTKFTQCRMASHTKVELDIVLMIKSSSLTSGYDENSIVARM